MWVIQHILKLGIQHNCTYLYLKQACCLHIFLYTLFVFKDIISCHHKIYENYRVNQGENMLLMTTKYKFQENMSLFEMFYNLKDYWIVHICNYEFLERCNTLSKYQIQLLYTICHNLLFYVSEDVIEYKSNKRFWRVVPCEI